MRRQSTGQLVVMNSYWTGLSIMWNGLHTLILPAMLLGFIPEAKKNSYLGLLTFLGLVVAMIIQPVAGALSDRWSSRWGRRRPLILIGTSVDFIFLLLLGWAGGIWMIFAGYVGLQLSSNLAHGAVQGLIPDKVPPEQVGMASGIKTVMDMSGAIIASVGLGLIVGQGPRSSALAMALVAAALAISASITLGGVREEPSSGQSRVSGLAQMWRETFHVDLRANTSYWWLLLSRFFYLAGVYGIQAFAFYYVKDKFRLSLEQAGETTGFLMGMIVSALVIFALLAGWLSDRWGRKRVLVLSCIVGALGALLLMAVQTTLQLLLFGAVLGAGLGMFLSANWALANDLAPSGEAGKFLGLTNLATAGAGAISRLDGPLIDLLNNARPEQLLGYTALFGLGIVGALISLGLLSQVRGQKTEIRDQKPGEGVLG